MVGWALGSPPIVPPLDRKMHAPGLVTQLPVTVLWRILTPLASSPSMPLKPLLYTVLCETTILPATPESKTPSERLPLIVLSERLQVWTMALFMKPSISRPLPLCCRVLSCMSPELDGFTKIPHASRVSGRLT